MIPLRKSTASQEVLLGPFLDDTDGKTAETALTIAASDIKIWKRGGTTESNKNSGGATHIASGRYYAVLDATDTDTTGELIINVAVAGALPVRLVCHVFEAAVFDSLFASGAAGYQVPIWASASATVNLSATTIKAVTDAVALPSSAAINITGDITGNLSGSVGSVTGAVGSVTGNVGGSVASVTGAVGSVTGNVGGTVASVVGNVGGNVTGSVGSVVAAVTAGTVSDKTGYSLTQAFPSNFSSLVISASGVVSANVTQWNGSSLPTIGTSTLTAQQVWEYASDRTLTTTIPSATDNAAAVWGASLNSYAAAGTFGGRIVRAANSNNAVQITGSNHVAADVHEFQPAVITAADFDLGAIDANALAADAAAEVASAVRTNLATELARIDVAISTRLATAGYTAPDNAGIASVKAKTDNLPASPAAVGDIPSATTIADAVLGRSVATTQGTAAEWSLCTLVLAALESSIGGSTWTIYRTDGTTPHAIKTITTDAAAEPITGVA